MPNRNYINGRAKEYRIVNSYKKNGCIAFRSAGSHSPVDVIAINPELNTIDLIQAKPDSMSLKTRAKLEKENKKLNGLFEVRFKVV